MIVGHYQNGHWQEASLEPYGPLALPPTNLALHYGHRTPLVLLVAYAAYGAVLGWGYG